MFHPLRYQAPRRGRGLWEPASVQWDVPGKDENRTTRRRWANEGLPWHTSKEAKLFRTKRARSGFWIDNLQDLHEVVR